MVYGKRLYEKSVNKMNVTRSSGISKSRLSQLTSTETAKLIADKLYLICLPLNTRNKMVLHNINNLNFSMIEKFEVPLPTLKKQIEIADHIRRIRQQAKQLQREADKELEKASREVEKLILDEQNDT